MQTLYPISRRLRIALVTETYPPDVNGVAQTLYKLVDGLRARGHELVLIRPKQAPGQVPMNEPFCQEVLVRGVPIPMYPDLKMGLPAKAMLQRLWTRNRPDLVHIATEGPLGWSAARVALKMKIPSTSDFRTNFHAYSQFYGMGWLQGAIVAYMRKFHGATDYTMVPTEELKAGLVKAGFCRLQVVPRGVDIESFSPRLRSTSLRAQWGADENTVVLLSVGRLAVEKNLDVVIKAYQQTVAAGVRARLVFVGSGPLRAQLAKRCPDAIFAGTRRGPELAAHYASADLFVFPSLTETFGNVTIEAMASGVPVVAYRCAAAGQLIKDGVSGVLAEPAHEEGLVFKAVALATDRARIDAMRLEARRVALCHDWASVVEMTEAVMQLALEKQFAVVDRQWAAA